MTAHAHLQRTIVMAAILAAVAGCGSDENRNADADHVAPIPVTLQYLNISGPAATPEAEISALCWYGDFLVLVPQHPERFGDEHGELGLFVLDRDDIEAAIDGRREEPLLPRRALLQAPDLLQSLPGWDGLEAAAAVGDTVYLAVEASVDGKMIGYLLRGFLDHSDEMLRLTVDTERITAIPVPTAIPTAPVAREAFRKSLRFMFVFINPLLKRIHYFTSSNGGKKVSQRIKNIIYRSLRSQPLSNTIMVSRLYHELSPFLNLTMLT